MSERVRVAFILEPRLLNWRGGFNYLRNLFAAVREHEPTLEPILFAGARADLDRFSPLSSLVAKPVVVSKVFDSNAVGRGTIALLTGRDRGVEALLKANGINVLFENANFHGVRFAIPALGWIPDLQHRHLREMFSKFAYTKRDFGFRLQLGSSRTVMVSSESVRRDCASFYGVPPERIAVVPFAAPRSSDLRLDDPETIRHVYSLPETFLFLPNQFWKHKNHILVCRALALLRDKGEQVCVAVSGNKRDYRHPEVFDEVRNYVDRESLSDSFRLLGEIPYTHLVALLRASTGLLNPSLSEGWSTSVEEAKAWGVGCVVSDIPVHHEQLGDNAIYFDPRCVPSVAEAMLLATRRWRPGPRPGLEREALVATRQRVAAFAAGFRSALELTMRSSNGATHQEKN